MRTELSEQAVEHAVYDQIDDMDSMDLALLYTYLFKMKCKYNKDKDIFEIE